MGKNNLEEHSEKSSEIISENKSAVSFKEAFRFWVKLGFISFGGPAGQIAIMHRELVERQKWISEEKFQHALNFCMFLPGPEAQQLATYNGWLLHGTKGGIAAGAFFVIPSIFILLALSWIYAKFGEVAGVSAVLDGVKAVVVAIVVEAVIKIGRKAFKSKWHVAIAAAAFVAIYFLHVPFPLIVLSAGVLGYFFQSSEFGGRGSGFRGQSSEFRVQGSELGAGDVKSREARERRPENIEPEDIEPENNKLENSKPKINFKRNILKVFAVCFGLWVVPFLLLILTHGWKSLPVKIYLFFTQAAFVTFGGAYAVLAYVNQIAVNSYGWLSAQAAIDGFGLAETTPGPLIMVLQFVGFMAGWNNPGGFEQTSFAVFTGVLTTYATFLPCFFFIFAFAPVIEKFQNNRKLKAILSGVTAAVVGVILNLALVFGAAVVFENGGVSYFAVLTGALSFLILLKFKIDVLWIVLGGGVFGLLEFLIFR